MAGPRDRQGRRQRREQRQRIGEYRQRLCRGRGRGRDDDAAAKTGWGSTSPESAREAVSQGWALALSTVLPTVSKAVPGKVLEVDLRQSWTGEWRYEFLILTRDRRYQEVVVDARRNQILQIRRR